MINEFDGKHHFLSNFWEHPIVWLGIDFNSVEAAYQASKALSLIIAREFSTLPPGQAKKKGRLITVRPDWENVKLGIMESLVRIKFTDNPWLKEQLLATGDEELIEGNWWGDTFWGVCKGVGQNNLGKILMQVRQELADAK